MGTSSGRSLNLAAVYKPAGGGGPGHCGRQGLAPLPGPSRAAGPRPPPGARPRVSPGRRHQHALHNSRGKPRDPRGAPCAPACALTGRTWSGGGIRGLGTLTEPRGLLGSPMDGVRGPQILREVPEPRVGGTIGPEPQKGLQKPRGMRCPGPATSGWSCPETLMDEEIGVPRTHDGWRDPAPHFLGAHLARPTVMLAHHPQKLLRDDSKKCSVLQTLFLPEALQSRAAETPGGTGRSWGPAVARRSGVLTFMIRMNEETEDKMSVSAPAQRQHWFGAPGSSLPGGPLKYTTWVPHTTALPARGCHSHGH